MKGGHIHTHAPQLQVIATAGDRRCARLVEIWTLVVRPGFELYGIQET